MKLIKQVSRGLVLVCQGILGLCLGVMSAAVLIQVILRTFFKTTWLPMGDLVVYLFSISTFVGAALVVRDGGNIAITFVTDLLKGKVAKAVHYVGLAIIAVFFGLLVVYGGQYAINGMQQFSPSLHIPIGPIYAAVPFSGLASLVFLLEQALTPAETK